MAAASYVKNIVFSSQLKPALRFFHNSIRRCQNVNSSEEKKTVITEQLGPVFLIGINRPEKRNAVNLSTGKQLIEAFKAFEDNESALTAVLYGKGGNFCAGFDLHELATADEKLEWDPTNGPMGPSRLYFKKPVIAAVDGYAVAGGLELALMCDLRVVEDSAIMGVFCRRFGVPLIDGGTVRLPQLIGLSRALDLILTGRAIKAQEALEYGLATKLTAIGTGLGEAINLAKSITKFPQECLLADRRSAFYSCFQATSMQNAFEFEHNNGISIIAKESMAGAQKFVKGAGKGGKFNFF